VLVVAAVLVALVAITLGWWADIPKIAAGSSNRLTAAGRLFGLYGGFLAGLAVLLMARVPWLDRAVGTDRLAQIHALVGRSVLVALSCHAVLIVVGYAKISGLGVPAQLRTLWDHYPHVLAATFGFGLLVLVGVTSARVSRSRLPYEVWHLVHLATYVAIGLAFWHPLAVGTDFRGHPAHQLLWNGWFVAVGTALLVFRFLTPAVRALVHRTAVEEVRVESAHVVTIRMTGRHMHTFGGTAGQFVRVRFLTRGCWWQSHPFSMSTAPTPDAVRVTVKACGRHTAALPGLSPGTRALLSGPYGGLVATRRTRPGVVLIAGGIGITPMRALFETLPADAGRLVLLHRAGREEDLTLRAELEELAEKRGGTVHHLLGPRPTNPEDEPLGPSGLARLVPDIAERDVFVCGPPAMMQAVARAARSLGVPRRSIHCKRFNL
jgi:predicted ferric reductase